MTDLQRFIELYKSVGIELVTERHVKGDSELELIIANNGSNEKICGYSTLSTNIVFDLDGKFIRQEFWE